MMHSRTLKIAGPLAVGALALAACGSSGSSPAASGAGKPVYDIGCQGPLSGDNSQLGINICDGVKLAVTQADAAGGLPFTLGYVGADDQGTPDQAPAAAQSLIQNSKVVAVVGPAFSGATQAAEPLFTQAGLASVTASATNPTLTDPKNGFTTFFRAVATDSDQGAGAALYLSKVAKVTKVFSLNDKSTYGAGLAAVLDSSLKADGVQVVSQGIQPTKDYNGIAQIVASSGAQALYYSGYYNEFGLLARAVRNAGYTGLLMSDDGSNDPHYISIAGTTVANGTLFTCPCTDASGDPALASFQTAYQKAFNMAPGTYSAEAFDAANAIISVLKQIGAHVTRGAVVSKLKTVDYHGLTKEIKFASNGQVATNAIFIYKVVGGKITFVGPVSKLVGA